MNVGLIDYGRGNLRSVEKALQRVGAAVTCLNDPLGIEQQDALVLPGVGSFGDAMLNLQERGLVPALQEWLKSDRPFLGICLGYQLLFESGEESPGISGLGFLPGTVVRFPKNVGKVPHMGWNSVIPAGEKGRAWFQNLDAAPYFYHVHSYYPEQVAEEDVACRTEYGFPFVSGISRGNVHAFQFHPEKSQENGLKLLSNFMSLCRTPASSPLS
ncbi:MAG: imidazole glycerol phosphate synthase subunit HisH [Blastochloris sp.]|nr:imidazole glycerol phosphate synthase subunit HisH [Blastochloris sp.]